MLNQDNSNSGKMIKIVLAKIAAEKQAKTKKNGASLLVKLGVTLVAIACYGFLYNQDTDWAIILIFGSIVTAYGAVNLKG
jgi:hypothetical protein